MDAKGWGEETAGNIPALNVHECEESCIFGTRGLKWMIFATVCT